MLMLISYNVVKNTNLLNPFVKLFNDCIVQVEGNENIYHGTIRVHLNLIQPISMRLGPAHLHPSLLTKVHDDDDYPDRMGSVSSMGTVEMTSSSSSSSSSTTSLPSSSVHHSLPELGNRYASFYVPPDVTKVIHVTR